MEEKKAFPQRGNPSSPASNPWEKSQSTQTVQPQVKQVEFSLFAPQAKSVSVAGTFNRWNPVAFSLKKDLQGNWKGSIPLKPGRYQYRFFVDGKWADDPKAKQTAPNEFGTKNAIVEVK
jgi:1,4-alpha-glucan branching enzyme